MEKQFDALADPELHHYLINTVKSRGASHADAEDTVQNVLVHVMSGPPRDLFESPTETRKFLTRCVKNRWLDEIGSAHRRLSRPIVALGSDVEELGQDPIDWSDDYAKIETRLNIYEAMSRLSEREGVALADLLAGSPDTETAERLGLSAGSVRKLRKTVRTWIDTVLL